MTTSRTIALMIFLVSSFFLYQDWSERRNPKPTALVSHHSEVHSSPAPLAGQPPAFQAEAKPPAQAIPQTDEWVEITTDTLKVRISPIGANLVYAELINYKTTLEPDSNNLILLDQAPQLLHLAQSGLASHANTSYPNHNTVFQIVSLDSEFSANGTKQAIFQAELNQVRLTKTYTFHQNGYLVSVRHTVDNQSPSSISPLLYYQLVRDDTVPEEESRFVSAYTGAAFYTPEEKFSKLSFKEISQGKKVSSDWHPAGWVAMVQHYFLTAWLPQEPVNLQVYHQSLAGPYQQPLYRIGLKTASQHRTQLQPQESQVFESMLYLGPQEQNQLESIAPGLELVTDYGILTFIASPLFWLLNQLHQLLHNWGWAIVALTVLVKLLFFPLSAASYRSMARMKALSPQMQALRERYKDDKRKLNEQMLKLFQAEKVNPMAGCLPIIIQIPVFLSLYYVLLATVEIRHAPWIGWIHDLAAPDPYFILPIVMAVTMYIQMKFNPKPQDPIQAKVMQFIPWVFSVMFLFFPSGLVLYWVVNNILSILQQWVVSRKFPAPPPKPTA